MSKRWLLILKCRISRHHFGSSMNSHWFDIRQRRTKESYNAWTFYRWRTHTCALDCRGDRSTIQPQRLCRKIQESRWIRKLGTSHRFEMNLRVDSLWNLCYDYLRTPWNCAGLTWRLLAIQGTRIMQKTLSINIMRVTTIVYELYKFWGRPHKRLKRREDSTLMPITCIWSIVNNSKVLYIRC